MAMQLILTQDIDNLGKAGELVTVKNGYARNYLVPQGLAISASARNVAKLEHEKATIERRIAKQRGEAESIATRLNGMTLQFERLVGEDDKMFGSVTARDIASQLSVAGVDIDARKIKLDEPVRAIGKYEVPVRCGADISANLKFWVVGKEKEA